MSTQQEALFYQVVKDNEVKCNLCNHQCKIADGKRGIYGRAG